jgi:hypothetical protein
VFRLTFDPSVDLFTDVNFSGVELGIIVGNRNQILPGVLQPNLPDPPVDPSTAPEPATASLIGGSLLGLLWLRNRR